MKARMHKNPAGFTLVEVLIVVLIVVMITMASVPVYRKTQDKNRYLAASGVLIELGAAMQMIQTEYPHLSIYPTVVNTNPDYISDEDPTPANIIAWLQSNKYLHKIPFSDDGTYMGYSFNISTSTASCSGGCIHGIACMSGNNLNSAYTCAWVDNSGILHHN